MTITCHACRANTDANLCQRCVDQLRVALTALPWLLDQLLVTATRQARIGGGSRPREVESDPAEVEAHLPAWLRTRQGAIALRSTAAPIDWSAADLASAAVNTLGTWARHLAEARGVELPTTIVLPAIVEVCRIVTVRRNRWRITEEVVELRPEQRGALDPVPWLLDNIDAIRLDEAAGEIHRDVTALIARVERAIDRRAPEVYAGPCNSPDVRVSVHGDTLRPEAGICGADLYGRLGQAVVTCDVCGAEYDVAERRAWLLKQVCDVWARPQVIADALDSLALPVKRKTIDKWASRGVLSPAVVDEGRPYYRVGDVIALVQAAADRMARHASEGAA